ncbi:MAG: protease modulator HflK [Verrucomicrobiota bacterium]|jgi:membrane protease subunit HflK
MNHEHEHEHDQHPTPVTPEDAGSQALAEALRSSFAIVKVAMLLMVLAFFSSGFFTVGPAEKAVILRFGKPVGEDPKALLGAGLHWSFPYPIDEVVKIPIAEIQKVTSNVGWYATTPEQELSGEELAVGSSLNPAVDGYAITADRNIVHVRVTLYYRIEDPIRAVFGFSSGTNLTYSLTGVSNAVQNVLNNALLYSAAHFGVDDILTRDVAGFRDAVLERVGDMIDQEQLGIVVDNCEVQSIPPRQLQAVFTQVTTAREERNKLLNDAHSYENQVSLRAGAQAASITNAAAADRARYVDSITAEAKRFNELLPRYESNPSLFVQQTLVQMIGPVLTNVQDKIFLPQRADGQSRELRLMLNREPPAPKTATQNR